MSRNNVTMIDDLPFIDDIESKSFMTGVPSAEMKQVSKFIRDTTYNPPYESGMMAYNNNSSNRVVQSPPPPPPQPQQQQRIQLPPAPAPSSGSSSGVEEYQPHQMIMSSLSCVDVAEHAANCIVCSRLYNTDMTLYIIIISILLLTIVILIKKVLDCPSR